MRVIYAIIFCSFIILSCGKGKPDEAVELVLEIPATMTPVKDTVTLGDTLLFTMNFSDTLKDTKSGNFYKIKNWSFPIFLSAVKINDSSKTVSEQPLSTHKFTYVSIISNFINTGTVAANFIPQYSSGSYKAICKIVPKEKGVFTFNLIYDTPPKAWFPDSVLNLPPSSEGRKRVGFLRVPIFNMNNGNVNFSLLQKNAKVGSNIYGGSNRDYRGYYTFVVK